MKKCEQIQNMLLLAETNEISPQEQAELDVHLAQCPACSVLRTKTKKIIDISRNALPSREPAITTINSILKEGNNYIARPAVFRLWRAATVLLPAAAILIAIAALFIPIHTKEQAKDTETQQMAHLYDLMAIISPTIEDFIDEYSVSQTVPSIRMVAQRLLVFQGFVGNDITLDMLENTAEIKTNDS